LQTPSSAKWRRGCFLVSIEYFVRPFVFSKTS
jgi:hypothetical protein